MQRNGPPPCSSELERNEQNILHLFRSPRSSACATSRKRNGIFLRTAGAKHTQPDEWMRFTGLTTVLRRHFYPDYDHQRSVSCSSTPRGRSAKRRRGRRRPRDANIVHGPLAASAANSGSSSDDDDEEAMDPGSGAAQRKRWGMQRGSLVDRQLTRIANMEWQHPDESEAAIFERVVESMGSSGMPHPMTLAIMRQRDAWGWTRLVSQFPVYWEEAMIASAVDCLHTVGPEKRLVLEETKTGFANYLLKSSGLMHPSSPMRERADHPLHQHLLQLLLCKMMLERLWGVVVHEAWVVQAASPTRVLRHPIPDWMLQREDEIWNYLLTERRKQFGHVVLAPLPVI